MKEIARSKEERLVEEIVKDFEQRREDRKSLELQWRLNMNFFNGSQYSEISPTGSVEQYGKQYFWQEREVYNHIASIVETRMCKLSRTKCAVSVRPFGSDDKDVSSARLSTQIVKALCEENDMAQLINTATTWSEVTGSCLFKVVWDAEKGRVAGYDTQGKPIKEGDVRVVIVPPYEIFPDRLSNHDVDDCRSIIHAKAYHVDEIKEIWGAEVESQEIDVFSLSRTQSAGGLGYGAGVSDYVGTKARECCIVIERYERPSAGRPNGRLACIAGNKLLYDGDLPFINGVDGERGFPFSKISCINRVGCFFGASVIERLIPLQRAYNAIKNRKHEFLNRVSMGVLAVEDGSVDTDDLEEEGLSPGKILLYRQGSNPPQMLDCGHVPSDFRSEEERILSEFITISGVSELSKYSQTYSSMSGKAISLLVEQDDTRLAIASDSIRLCVKRVCQQMLRLYRQFAIQPRLKRIAGENGDVDVTYFRASDLQSDDLVFDNENELSDTLASRRSMALELVNMGILQDEDGKMSNRNKLRVLELLGFGNWESSRDLDECQRKNAVRENLEAGKKSVEVGELDDDALHIEEHTKAVLTDGRLSEGEKKKLTAHIAAHRSALLRKSVFAAQEGER